MKLFLIFALFAYSVYAENHYISDDLKPLTYDMIKAINDLESTWKAGENFNFNKLIVTQNETYYNDFSNKKYETDSLPKTFDAREAWPNCPSIGKIYNQRKGYPSWIYPAVGSVADRLCIQAGVQIDVEATVDRMMKSTNFNSANIGQVFAYWSKSGIYTVESSKNANCTPFSTECRSNEIKFQYYNVTIVNPTFCNDKMSDIMINGPLPAYINVHSDFPSYKSGVYKIHSKITLGMHNIKLIGWGSENGVDYWSGTNSWGSDWGENGIFKIKSCANQLDASPQFPSAVFTPAITSGIIGTLSQDQLFDLA